jgi:hypothetical protein
MKEKLKTQTIVERDLNIDKTLRETKPTKNILDQCIYDLYKVQTKGHKTKPNGTTIIYSLVECLSSISFL